MNVTRSIKALVNRVSGKRSSQFENSRLVEIIRLPLSDRSEITWNNNSDWYLLNDKYDNSSKMSKSIFDTCLISFPRHCSDSSSISSVARLAAVVNKTRNPFKQAFKPNAIERCVLLVPEYSFQINHRVRWFIWKEYSDNGSPMKGATLLETLIMLGVMPSNSRPRVSNDNAYAEAIFKTLKYRPGYPRKGVATIEDARDWVLGFARWYNKEHRHSGLNFLTPEQRHNGQSEAVLANRRAVYEAAKLRHPERWSGKT